MKTKMKMVMAFVAFALCASLWATDGTWLYREGVGVSVTAPADWADPANWVGGNVATGKHSLATFAGTTNLWVSIPDGYWLGSVTAQGGSTNTTFLGETINMSDSSHTWKGARFWGSSANVELLRVWADKINVEGQFAPHSAAICAPFEADSVSLSYTSPFRRDWFATSGDENVSNIWNASTWTVSAYQQIYAPNGKKASTGYWIFTEGKKLAKYVSGTKGRSLAPGQAAVADGILPDGTFVKRTYSDDFIELSNAALASSSDDGVEVSFGAFTINMWQDIPSLATSSSSAAGSAIRLNKGDTGSVVFNIGKITGYPTFYTGYGLGLTVLHDVSEMGRDAYQRGDSYVRFAGTDDICDMTLDNVYFLQGPNMPRLGTFNVDVPAARSLTIDSIALNGGVTISLTTAAISKTGDGALTVRNSGTESPKIVCSGGEFVYDVSGCKAEMSLQSVAVNGGTFEPVVGANGAEVSAITVKAGAAYRYTQSNAALEIGSLSFESGAILEVGAGAVFDSASADFAGDVTIRGPGSVTAGGNWTNCTLENGALIAMESVEGARVTSEPVPSVVGHPAFWVDACDFTNETIVAECVEDGKIKRWNDHRAGETDVYAYKDGVRPDIVYDAVRGFPAVKLERVKGTPTDGTLDDFRCMVWNKALSGIRAVFLVEAPNTVMTPGGCVLGSTPGLGSVDFRRDNIATWTSPLVSGSAAECVREGDSYVWGVPGKPTVQTFNGVQGVQMVELHPVAPGGTANAFAINGGIANGSGAMTICECIVYTNALSYAERAQVAQYLHKKWISPDTSVYYDETAPCASMGDFALCATTSGVSVAENGFVEVSSLAGEGAFVKGGAGELYVADAANASANLTVAAGTARIRSYTPTTNDFPSVKPFIRLDATATNTLLLGSASAEMPVGDETTRADRWLDAEGGPYRASPRNSTYPNWYLKNEGPLGQPVVDLGSLIVTNNEWKLPDGNRFMMQFSESPGRNGSKMVTVTNVASAFMVWGSKYGGNQFLGDFNSGHGIFRNPRSNADTTVADWIAAPIYGGKAAGYENDARVSMQTEWRKNGEAINPYTTGLSGTWDIVSYLTPYRGMSQFAFSALGFRGAAGLSGGMQIGEFIAYTSTVTRAEYRIVDAYLNKKWFNRDVPGYRPARLGMVEVQAGATLEVDGNAPIVCSALKGAGTVYGAVELAAGAVIEVPVNADGTVTQTMTVSGDVDVSHGGVVRLTGYVNALAPGDYLLVSSESVDFDGEWAVEGYTGRKKTVLKNRSSGLWFCVVNDGFSITFR